MNIEKSIKLGRVTALITFLLGTGIFGLYFLTASNKFLYIGNFYLIFFGLFNLMVLISLSEVDLLPESVKPVDRIV